MQQDLKSPVAERYLWACAAEALRVYGDGARDEIDRRIEAMAAAGDDAGHATWVNIALCLIVLTAKGKGEITR